MKNNLLLLALLLTLGLGAQNQKTERPNIILVMVDDLGYGDLGSYGQKVIQTPHLDQMALEGLRFTQFYAGSPVCAPSRSVLMTGLHTGHTTVRGNTGIGGVRGLGGAKGRIPLKADDLTLAQILKQQGYHTAMTGKWGLGEPNTTGLPNDHGFDDWFGFLNQRRAHHHYTDYLWRNRERVDIPHSKKHDPAYYSHNLFTGFALDYLAKRKKDGKPFFLYVPYLLPHAEYEIPEIHPDYVNEDWTYDEKVHASMVRLIDSDMGKIRKKLEALGMTENTLILFTSDNGAALRWEGRFDSSGPLKGRKRDVYEGGIRTPLLAVMPGTVPQGKVSEFVGYFPDIFPTLAEMAGAKAPKGLDGIPFTSILEGKDLKPIKRSLYWEFHEQGGKQAVRLGKWKGVRLEIDKKGFHSDLELYDLEADSSETHNLATTHLKMVKRILKIMKKEHRLSTSFPYPHEKTKLNTN
ncbi:arylsulfatase [Sediminicola luteus]|uniref:Sulfatase n=1 Tax=Sediminicola luteus TaxID=319238 RepID=A0A2A4G8U2_9FLAO|nr:arylsulfatase [Sediminicola luteus]PCE64406.1 sulfatase [Sediminicola luteus]